jgi:hypothetical protein
MSDATVLESWGGAGIDLRSKGGGERDGMVLDRVDTVMYPQCEDERSVCLGQVIRYVTRAERQV